MHKLSSLYTYITSFSIFIFLLMVFLIYVHKEEFESKAFELLYEKQQIKRQKNKFSYFLFSKKIWILITALGMMGFYGLMWLYPITGLNDSHYFSNTNYFSALFFGPVIAIPVMLISGVDFRKTLDTLTIVKAFHLFVGKIACYFGGCCYGIECSFGLYMPERDRIEFPIQFTESFVGLLIAIFLLFCIKKGWFKSHPFYLLLFYFLSLYFCRRYNFIN